MIMAKSIEGNCFKMAVIKLNDLISVRSLRSKYVMFKNSLFKYFFIISVFLCLALKHNHEALLSATILYQIIHGCKRYH